MESWGEDGVRLVGRCNREMEVIDNDGGEERRNGEAKGYKWKSRENGGRRKKEDFIRGGKAE